MWRGASNRYRMALNVAAFSQAYRNSEAALTCVETSLAGASRSLSGQVLPGSEDRSRGCAYDAVGRTDGRGRARNGRSCHSGIGHDLPKGDLLLIAAETGSLPASGDPRDDERF